MRLNQQAHQLAFDSVFLRIKQQLLLVPKMEVSPTCLLPRPPPPCLSPRWEVPLQPLLPSSSLLSRNVFS